ncbi:epidermal growth factor receptor pathway substrate 15 isoform X2 [Lycorma delicatula]|uniref:epidermal growth factor receptor pathway substrate 15 isoform X2 n=1 Tax=Lycorma delicatula TaxID=130591 RepID=UPI003F511002
MAALPSPTQVAGSQYSVYEAYYQQVDPTNQGTVGAVDAAKFLKKSGLSDIILSKIWDLSDPNGKGYLNKAGFFVALKLVSLAQSGKEVNVLSTTTDVPPPKMGDTLPPLVTQHNSIGPPPVINSVMTTSDWAMKPAERAKYEQLFDSLQPSNGLIPGNKVKGLLVDSKLPFDTLGKIWDLADMDKDGSLDRHEFIVAMHLVYKALEKYAIPNVLPPELMPPGKRKDSIPSGPVIPVSAVPVSTVSIAQSSELPKVAVDSGRWVVNDSERARYHTLFVQTDIDKDGYVSGNEVKDVFLKSGLAQPVLAHIWGLCDIKQTGKLNSEQFALAMWLIGQKLLGADPPTVLSPDMIPPSFRSKPDSVALQENSTAAPSPYSNPELDMISKDIEELVLEKQCLENEILQKEADIKIKNGEVKSLQGELDTLAATLKQLENQKGEAQKRLNDLKNQVDNLRRQAEEQETSLKAQEAELNARRQELEGLKQEETRLEKQQEELRQRLENLGQNLQDSQLQISQVKAKITQVQEHQRQMNDVIALSENAITSGDSSTVPDTCLNFQPEFRDPSYTKLVNGYQEDTSVHSNKDPFSSLNGPTAVSGGDAFDHNDAFSNDPFKSTTNPSTDPFASTDNFNSGFTSKNADNFSSDPFNSFGSTSGKTDPFDPFGDGGDRIGAKTPDDMSGKDPFGCDPFAALHPGGGPPPRPESPSPALPPKKSKRRPPRPAPPKMQPQLSPSPDPFTGGSPSPNPSTDPFSAANDSDPFAGGGGGGNAGGFADFSNFNSKFSEMTGKENAASSTATKSATSNSTLVTTSKNSKTISSPLDFTEDPFRDYRYEDPFNIGDPFEDTSETNNQVTNKEDTLSNETEDPFGLKVSNGKMTPLPSEDQQLAWASAESIRMEEERKKEQMKEIADLQLALALSKKEKPKNRVTSGWLLKKKNNPGAE